MLTKLVADLELLWIVSRGLLCPVMSIKEFA
jgi:hypothetical protein